MCDDMPDLRCLLSGRHQQRCYDYKVLFVSRNHDLLKFLRDRLKPLFDCYIDYCPSASQARLLLEHDLYFTLCLFDDLPDVTGAELADFTRTLANRKTVPIILVSELIQKK